MGREGARTVWLVAGASRVRPLAAVWGAAGRRGPVRGAAWPGIRPVAPGTAAVGVRPCFVGTAYRSRYRARPIIARVRGVAGDFGRSKDAGLRQRSSTGSSCSQHAVYAADMAPPEHVGGFAAVGVRGCARSGA